MVTRDRFSYSNYRFTREERRYTPLKIAGCGRSQRALLERQLLVWLIRRV